jgi:predicted NACHT family NTPase
VDLPATRGELYDKAVEKLLTERQSQRVEAHYPGKAPEPDEKRAILAHVAFGLFAKNRERLLTFTGTELRQAFRKALSKAGYGKASALWANALRKDFVQNSGILRGSAAQGYCFLHPTFQEFLTAEALTSIVDDPDERGWQSRVKIGSKTWTVQESVNKKAWDPRWQEVIMLLAGQLRDPGPLFEILETQKDDMFHHRLALAALCLPELTPTIRALYDITVNRITTAAFSLWWQHAWNGTTLRCATSQPCPAFPSVREWTNQ